MLPRVLTRYLTRELFTHTLAITVIVVAISIARRLGNYLQEAASGQLPVEMVVQLVGIRTIVALPSLLPIGLYFGTVLVLRRLYADNEMTALEAAGVQPMRVGRVIVAFAIAFAVLDAVIALAVRPRAARKFAELASVLRLTSLQPGRFYEIGDAGDVVVFIGGKAADGTLTNVFLQKREGERLLLTACDQATEHVTETEDYRFLALSEGRMYEFDGEPRSNSLTITQYRNLLIRIPLRQPVEGWKENAKYSGELLRSAEIGDAAELQWRLAMPISSVLLAVTAVALVLSRVPGVLLLALALYVAYEQSLGVAKSWVERGILAPSPGLWLVHAIWLGLLFTVLWRLRSGRFNAWRYRS